MSGPGQSYPVFQLSDASVEGHLRRQPSLRSQLNQIRLWVRQGRTDAWIAHKLDVTIEQLERFKDDHDLNEDSGAVGRPADPLSVPPPEADLYESSEEEEEEEEPEPVGSLIEEPEEEPAPARAPRGGGRGGRGPRPEAEPSGGDDEGPPARKRRRGRRGGRRRRRPSSYEATFDHGEEGYGLWLDPAVVDNPVYAQHWAGHREVEVTLGADTITIRKANADGPESADSEDPDENGEDE